MRDLADLFTALSDPSRLGMLALLQRHGEMCVCDIQEVLGVTQSRASRHLQVLRRAGLVQDRRVGSWVHYRLADRPAGRQRLLLRTLPKLVDDAAAATIDTRLAAWQRTKEANPCVVDRKLARAGRER